MRYDMTHTITSSRDELPPRDELKLARRLSRRQGLFAPDLLKAALKQAFVMLRPDIQWKNPVMFVVEVGTVLTHRLHGRQACSAIRARRRSAT